MNVDMLKNTVRTRPEKTQVGGGEFFPFWKNLSMPSKNESHQMPKTTHPVPTFHVLQPTGPSLSSHLGV
jgi:hypothetical protein